MVQRFGRFIPFVRYGYADVNARGPTPAKHMASVGLVIDNIFGQDTDRIGFGYTWADPADRALHKQSEIDAHYRGQLTPEIQIAPTLSVIFDPVRNPDEDRISVWGFRTRIALQGLFDRWLFESEKTGGKIRRTWHDTLDSTTRRIAW